MLQKRSQRQSSSKADRQGQRMAGPNIVVNSNFDTDLSGWAQVPGGGSIQWVDGAVRLVNVFGAPAVTQSGLPADRPVRVRFRVTEQSGVNALIRLGGTNPENVIVSPGLGIHEAVRVSGSGGNIEIFKQNPGAFAVDFIIVRMEDVNMSKVVLTLRDYDGDRKQTSVELGPVTDGASYTTREGQAAAIRDAVNAVAGNIAAYDFLAQSTEPNNVNTATPVFQTHIRWIVELFDSITGDGPYAFDIPTADLSNADLVLPSSVEHDPAAAEWIALKAALNGIVINPRTGSTMTVGRIYLEE